MPADGGTGFDRVVGFSVPGRNVRGRVVRLGPVLDEVLSAHEYPLAIRHLLAEALVVTALVGSLLKDDDGQITLQAQTEAGVVDLLVCDYRAGELRGHVRHDADKLSLLGANPSLFALFGKGYLAITFDLSSTGQRYQGIVPLEGDSLASACAAYFAQSEQIPTLFRVGVRESAGRSIAGGMLMQHLPAGEEGRGRLQVEMDHPDWEHAAILGGSIRHDELVDADLSLEAMIWRLFHEEPEVRAVALSALSRGCRCSVEHYRTILSRFPEAERSEMRDENGQILVDCAYCSKVFQIEL